MEIAKVAKKMTWLDCRVEITQMMRLRISLWTALAALFEALAALFTALAALFDA